MASLAENVVATLPGRQAQACAAQSQPMPVGVTLNGGYGDNLSSIPACAALAILAGASIDTVRLSILLQTTREFATAEGEAA